MRCDAARWLQLCQHFGGHVYSPPCVGGECATGQCSNLGLGTCSTQIRLPWAVWVALGDAELCFVTVWRKGTEPRCWVLLICGRSRLRGGLSPELSYAVALRVTLSLGFQVAASSQTLKCS